MTTKDNTTIAAARQGLFAGSFPTFVSPQIMIPGGFLARVVEHSLVVRAAMGTIQAAPCYDPQQVVVITVYEPDPERWTADFTRRKRK